MAHLVSAARWPNVTDIDRSAPPVGAKRLRPSGLGVPVPPSAKLARVVRAPRASNIDAYQNAGLAWPIDPQRRQVGFGFLKLRPRDMAKIGTLYLNQGAGKEGGP